MSRSARCVELAPALGRGGWPESASKLSKLAALHTLREVRQQSGAADPNSYWKDSERLKFLGRFRIFGA